MIISKYHYLIPLVFILAIGLNSSAQNIQISGYIKDASSGEPLVEATVSEMNSKKGGWTNKAGYFSISIPRIKAYKLRISYVGYKPQIKIWEGAKDTIINVSLETNQLDTINIEASASRASHSLGVIDIPISHIQKMPMLFGETDVLKAFQMMPGVQGGTEGSTGLHVRGGSPDQNLILLDDVPLYYVNHAGGFISLFDADAIGYARLYKGSFPARFGGRLSSVLDLRIKEGNKKEWKKQFAIGLLSTRLLVEGPIREDKSSLLLSGRFSTLGPISWGLNKLADTDANTQAYYTFYDLYAKYSHIASLKNRFYTSVYVGRDGLNAQTKSRLATDSQDERSVSSAGLGWGNQMASFRWQHLYHSRLFHHLTLAFTRFSYETQSNTRSLAELDGGDLISNSRFRSNSGIQDWIAKLDYDYYPQKSWEVKFGGAIHKHAFRPGVTSIREQSGNNSLNLGLGAALISSWEGNVYGEIEGQLGSRLTANIGAHASAYSVRANFYSSIQPRALLSLNVSDRFQIQTSFASMQQYLHLLTRSNIGLPSDLWVPVTDAVPPQNSQQWVAGFNWLWPGLDDLSLRIEGFYKTFNGLIAYQEGASSSELNDWEQQLETRGVGTAKGLEILVQKKRGASTGWVGYTLSMNERQFAGLNAGKKFPYTYDRRHVINFSLNHSFSAKFSLSTNWVYMSGRPLTFALSTFPTLAFPDGPDQPEFFTAEFYRNKNALRMPAYHRLDLSFQWRKKLAKGDRLFSLGFYNLYNQQNPFFYFFYQENFQSKAELSQFTLFPILPFISWQRRY